MEVFTLRLLHLKTSHNFLTRFVLITESEGQAEEFARGGHRAGKGGGQSLAGATMGEPRSHCLFIPLSSAHSIAC